MKRKWKTILIIIIIALVLFQHGNVGSQSQNVCAQHPNKQWAWTVNSPWMSTDKTGDWKTDTWFYMLKPGEPVVVIQADATLGYYLVCYDFGSDTGWQALVGWVQEDNILLQSSITPVAE